MIPYTEFRYFYPPRTDMKIPINSSLVTMWGNQPDAVAQYKLNGDRCVVAVSPDHNVRLWTRHMDGIAGRKVPREHKFAISQELKSKIIAIAPKGFWTLFDTELVDKRVSDTPTLKSVLYFFDVLVWQSQYLVGMTYGDRYAIIQHLLKDYISIDEKLMRPHSLYLARNIPANEWKQSWDAIQRSRWIEGLVLKRTGPISQLVTAGTTEVNNAGFMARVRKPTKNYLT